MSNTLTVLPRVAGNGGAAVQETGTQFKADVFSSLTAAVLKFGSHVAPAAEMLHHIFGLTAEKDLYSGFAYRVDDSGKVLSSINARLVGETASAHTCGILKDPNAVILTNTEDGYRSGRFYLLDLKSMLRCEIWEGRMVFSRHELSPAEVSAIAAKGPVAHGQHDYVGDIHKADARLWPAYSGPLTL